MNTLMALKAYETLIVKWRAAGLDAVPEALRKPLAVAWSQLEALSIRTGARNWRCHPSEVQGILDVLRQLHEASPALRDDVAQVVLRLAPTKFILRYYASDFTGVVAETVDVTGDLKSARAQARKTLADSYPKGRCELWSECTYGLPYEVLRGA